MAKNVKTVSRKADNLGAEALVIHPYAVVTIEETPTLGARSYNSAPDAQARDLVKKKPDPDQLKKNCLQRLLNEQDEPIETQLAKARGSLERMRKMKKVKLPEGVTCETILQRYNDIRYPGQGTV